MGRFELPTSRSRTVRSSLAELHPAVKEAPRPRSVRFRGAQPCQMIADSRPGVEPRQENDCRPKLRSGGSRENAASRRIRVHSDRWPPALLVLLMRHADLLRREPRQRNDPRPGPDSRRHQAQRPRLILRLNDGDAAVLSREATELEPIEHLRVLPERSCPTPSGTPPVYASTLSGNLTSHCSLSFVCFHHFPTSLMLERRRAERHDSEPAAA